MTFDQNVNGCCIPIFPTTQKPFKIMNLFYLNIPSLFLTEETYSLIQVFSTLNFSCFNSFYLVFKQFIQPAFIFSTVKYFNLFYCFNFTLN